MSSVTSYCPALRGSCGGGYEGGVHLFTPRKAGAKRARKGCKGVGGKGGSAGHKAKEKKAGEVDSKTGNIVSNVSETDTTPQHQVMLPKKAGTKTYKMSLLC